MINVHIHRNNGNDIYGFQLSGHANFAEEGEDIVCSAVSILVLNTINCIECFTEENFECEAEEENGGFINFLLPEIKTGKKCHDAQLLLKAMVHGLMDIKKEYQKYITIHNGEV